MKCSIMYYSYVVFCSLTLINQCTSVEQSGPVVFIRQDDFLLSASVWDIVIDINVTNYFHMLDEFWVALESIENIDMGNITERFHNYAESVSGIIDQEVLLLKKETMQTYHKLKNILTTLAPHRNERSLIDLGGHFLHYMFGVATDKNLEAVNEKVNNLNSQTDHIVHLMTEQISYIKSSFEAGHRNRHDIEGLTKVMEYINKKVDQTQEALSNLTLSFELTSQIIFNIQSALRTMEHALSSITQDVVSFQTALEIAALGRLSNYFISPEKLQEILAKINSGLGDGYSLLTNLEMNQMFLYYTLSTVRLATMHDRIRLFLTIPLKSHNTYFQLFRAIPLPFLITNTTAVSIKVEYPFFAITQNREFYLELDAEDMSNCRSGFIKICPPTREILKTRSHTCLASLFMGDSKEASRLCQKEIILNYRQKFYRQKGGNSWLYSVRNKEKLIVECPSKNKINNIETNQVEIENSGKISIPSNCKVQGDNFLLLPHSVDTIMSQRNADIHVPNITNILQIITSEENIHFNKTVGNEQEILEIIKANNYNDVQQTSVPLHEWQRQLIEIQKLKSVSIFGSPIVSISFSTVIFVTFTLGIMFWYRKRIITLFVCKKHLTATKEKQYMSVDEMNAMLKRKDENNLESPANQ